MKSLLIILIAPVMAVLYGVVHDLFTANICVEYFTIGHPKVIESEPPFLLALVWGFIATWWVGLPMGVLITFFNMVGKRPSLDLNTVTRLIFRLLIIMFGLAIIAGITGYILAETGSIYLLPFLADQLDPELHSTFLAVGWSHGASYLSGIIGTIVLCFVIYSKRKMGIKPTDNQIEKSDSKDLSDIHTKESPPNA